MFASLAVAVAVAFDVWAAVSEGAAVTKPKVIFETDFTLDVDDVGALAVLHALADRGEVDILAVSYNEVQPRAAHAIRAVNAWYGRDDIPVGVFDGELNAPDDAHSRYIEPLAHMAGEGPVPLPSRQLYRQVLERQPDGSVTIISVGFLNNLYQLLASERDLIAAKVHRLVQMGGVRNDGFNFVRHDLAEQTAVVLQDWPTPIVVSQEGGDIQTGAALANTPANNPVREAYWRWFEGAFKNRSSWDQIAVLYGVRGLGELFDEVSEGEGLLRNGFQWRMRPGQRSYLVVRESADRLAQIIERLMVAPPRRTSRDADQAR